MKPFSSLWPAFVLGLAAIQPGVTLAQQPKATPAREGIEFFETKIRPVLVNNCYECHSAKAAKVKGGLLPGHPRRPAHGRRQRPRHRPGRSRQEPADQGAAAPGRAQDAAQGASCPRQVIADFEQWIADGRPRPAHQRRRPRWKKLTPGRGQERSGRSSRCSKHAAPTVKDAGLGRAPTSTASSWPGWKRRASQPVADADRDRPAPPRLRST